MIVACDTMTLIWGMQEDPVGGNPRQANLSEMRQRARILFAILEDERAKLIIPSVSVSELLIKVEEKNHAAYLAALQARFFVPAFDLPAASLAARLWLLHRKLPKDQQSSRTTLKADVQIIATAKMAGAERFYSNDQRCRTLARLAGTDARDLPTNHPDMFRDAEIKGKTKP